MKSLSKCILSLVWMMLAAVSAASAQTAIPDTAEQRKARAIALEQQSDLDNQPAKLRELAMIHAVVAGLDETTPEATKRAVVFLEKAEKANPKDYELMAAYGSVLTMLAKFQKSTAQQFRYTKKGFRRMDRAIKKDPDNIGALLQRANNSLNVPVFLKRAHYARKDLEHVLKLVGDKKGKRFKAMILYQLGLAYELMNENEAAKEHWRTAVGLKAGIWSDKAFSKLNG